MDFPTCTGRCLVVPCLSLRRGGPLAVVWWLFYLCDVLIFYVFATPQSTLLTATQKKAMRYDRDGDSHYDILSAFQKSIRGSDPDAAVHYLARLVSAGDLPSICRRLLVISAEDIGLAYPQAISVVKACVDSALQLGFPEARIPLAEAVILLATAPKSNSAIMAIDSALSDIEGMDTGDIPEHLKDSHYG